jgi:hypothetical protein
MTPEERERMNSLCIGLQEETDFNKYATLLRDLSELLARKDSDGSSSTPRSYGNEINLRRLFPLS